MCTKQGQQGRMSNVHKTGTTRKDGYCAQNRDDKKGWVMGTKQGQQERMGNVHKTGTTKKDG
jgi:hypothetical protein